MRLQVRAARYDDDRPAIACADQRPDATKKLHFRFFGDDGSGGGGGVCESRTLQSLGEARPCWSGLGWVHVDQATDGRTDDRRQTWLRMPPIDNFGMRCPQHATARQPTKRLKSTSVALRRRQAARPATLISESAVDAACPLWQRQHSNRICSSGRRRIRSQQVRDRILPFDTHRTSTFPVLQWCCFRTGRGHCPKKFGWSIHWSHFRMLKCGCNAAIMSGRNWRS